jgi:uncharacterized RDD family membrane protein YckC
MTNSGLLRRLAAIIYDSLLVLALMFLVTLPFIAAHGGQPVETNDNLLYQACLALVIFLFFCGFWSWSGRTLGMQSWGLRVETTDGNIPGFGQASIRFFAAILSWAAVGLGFLWQLWDKDQLTWHDRISGTRLRYYPKPTKKPD